MVALSNGQFQIAQAHPFYREILTGMEIPTVDKYPSSYLRKSQEVIK